MTALPNRPNQRARRVELLSTRGRVGRHATERTRPPAGGEEDGHGDPPADDPPPARGAELDASLWFG
jgi:hypothetical protein